MIPTVVVVVVVAVAVVVVAVVVVQEDWKITDPICTYIFGILIIFTTCRIMMDILRILMEGKTIEKTRYNW